MKNYGYIKVAVASPKLKVANPEYNSSEIFSLIKQADEKKSAIIVFPELSITGYTCGDLFNQKFLLDKSLNALNTLIDKTSHMNILSLIGIPIYIKDGLYNCAVAIQGGEIVGVVPKMFIPNYKEFYEKRWFSSGHEISKHTTSIEMFGKEAPFGNLILKANNFDFAIGIEICIWYISNMFIIDRLNLAINSSIKLNTYRRLILRGGEEYEQIA